MSFIALLRVERHTYMLSLSTNIRYIHVHGIGVSFPLFVRYCVFDDFLKRRFRLLLANNDYRLFHSMLVCRHYYCLRTTIITTTAYNGRTCRDTVFGGGRPKGTRRDLRWTGRVEDSRTQWRGGSRGP